MLTRSAPIVVVMLLAWCAPAQGRPYLTTTRALSAVQRYAAKQGGAVSACQRIGRTRVDCGVSIPLQVTSGPGTATASATIQAFLWEGAGPYLVRVGEWSFAITVPVS
jgi:hypothetical protein